MDSLDNTEWDVVIAGTGLQESLLALALSRSGKKILHIDKNDYYGGAEAALSLQEAETWANESDSGRLFAEKSLFIPIANDSTEDLVKLSFSRAYSLALAPQIIYSRSTLLPALVSSRVDTQLEFLAIGSWWVRSNDTGTLLRVPSGREDVFADQNVEIRAKRALMRFLRFISDYENHNEIWQDYKDYPFSDFLLAKFALPTSVQLPLLALTFLSDIPSRITTSIALPRIARHLSSIGVFGPGFGAVIPKWGGLSEIAQVGCRAGAVGGGVYVLGNGLEEIMPRQSQETTIMTKLKLKNGDVISACHVVTSKDNMPSQEESQGYDSSETVCKSICIISSPLQSLFPPLAEGRPSPAAAVVVFPGSVTTDEGVRKETPQIIISVHSADTGECPCGQSVLYSSVTAASSEGFNLLEKVVAKFLESVEETTLPRVLWKLQYIQKCEANSVSNKDGSIIQFPSTSLDMAFDDKTMERVRDVWQKVMGEEAVDIMHFPAREDNEAGDEE